MAQQPQSRASYTIRVVGAAPTPLRDAYHAFLTMPWWRALGLIIALYLVLNALFALAYMLLGGIENARPGSYADAFIFSVQTMATIGYGVMHPVGTAAHILVVVESVTGLCLIAVVSGLVFTKFARSRARVAFARNAVISPRDGVPHLMIRFGNERGNNLVDVTLRVDLVRTEKTNEGHTFYRMLELPLLRGRAPQLTRSFTIMHVIDATSLLAGRTPDAIEREETELIVTIVGLDDTTGQTVHATHRYLAPDIIWGARYVDILSETEDGNMVLDLRRFHHTEATQPTEGFPYPAAPTATLQTRP